MTTAPIEIPISEEARRRAVCAAVAWAPRLIRYAARYSVAPEDAEDVYQRAMEIALTRAPTSNQSDLLRWLYVVVRNEAMALARERRRELASEPDGIVDRVDSPGADVAAEWHERHRQLRDALGTLTESERTCVALSGAGLSYAEIVERTGFTQRKVERSLVEGRSRLHDWEARMREGSECDSIEMLLIKVAEDDASTWERRRASRHVGHCGTCRGELRQLRARRVLIASLVPTGLMSGTVMAAQPADPSALTETWQQISGATTVRVGGLWQSLFDSPGPVLAKVAAAAAAAAVIVGTTTGLARPQVEDGVAGARAASALAAVSPASVLSGGPRVGRNANVGKQRPRPNAHKPSAPTTPLKERSRARAQRPPEIRVPARVAKVVRRATPRPASPKGRGSAAIEFIP
jgi:RNA polymerase sigma factor (sigma-70 family)